MFRPLRQPLGMPKRFNKRQIRGAPRKMYAFVPKSKSKSKAKTRNGYKANGRTWPSSPGCQDGTEPHCERLTNPTKGKGLYLFYK